MFKHIARIAPWMAILLLFFIPAGCGRNAREDSARATVEDPRAYASEALQTMDLNSWWQAYRNPDPILLGQIVDDIAADQPDGLPTDMRRLDSLIRSRIASRYKLHMDDTEEGKAYILAQAKARFANPPMATWDPDGHFALLDYHVLPGTWKSTSRVSEGLKEPPAVGDNPFLTVDVLATSLQKLVAAYPDARVYQIRYQYHFGSDLKKITMEFAPDRRIAYTEGGRAYFTAEPVSWDDLRNGRIDLAALDWDQPMEGYDGPRVHAPPDEPLVLDE